jgi:hypothetical protein
VSGGRAPSPSPLWLVAPALVAPLLLACPSAFWRVAAGLVAVAPLPGALLVGLLNTYRPLPGRQRAALVIPAGLALTVLLLLALDYSGYYSYRLAAALLALLEEGLAVGWLWRGRACHRMVGRIRLPRRGGGIALAAAALVFLGTVAHAATTPRRVARLTEFYLLDPGGRLPLSLGEEGVRVVVISHEDCEVRYRILARGWAAGQEIALGAIEATLPAGARWEQAWELPAGLALEGVAFSLLKDGEPHPYRQLWVGAEPALVEELEDAGGGDGEKEEGQRGDGDPQGAVDARRPRGLDGRHDLADGE